MLTLNKVAYFSNCVTQLQLEQETILDYVTTLVAKSQDAHSWTDTMESYFNIDKMTF